MTDHDSDNPMAGVPDWALQSTALYGASGTVWIRSDPAPSGLIGWYPAGVGIAKPWSVVEQDGPRKPEICSPCWFSDCGNCSEQVGINLPCDHLRIGHRAPEEAA